MQKLDEFNERRFLVDHYLALSGDGVSFAAARRTPS